MHNYAHINFQFVILSMKTIQDQTKCVVSTEQIIHNKVNHLLTIT